MDIFIIFPFLILFVSFGTLGYIYFKNGKKLFEEEGKTPLYTERVALHIDLMKVSGPLGRISVYEDLVVLRGFTDAIIQKKDIKELKNNTNTFSRAIEIYYFDSKMLKDKKVRIWTMNNLVLFEMLEKYLKS